jgi:CubicO group peptidase (beta-lactamase class C family)
MIRNIFISACAMLGMSFSAMAADPGSPAAAAPLDRTLRSIVNDEAHRLASLSVLAIKEGRIVYAQQFGHRFIDATNPAYSRAANADTLYRVASISKLITTIGVMRLVEAGTLSLDADISEVLGYRVRNPHFPDDAITLRMLLTHTSSLRDGGGYYWPAPARLKDALLPGGALYGSGAMWAKNAKPGAYFQYANLPWGVVGTLMERATGERFDRLMKRLVLDPLGLHGGFNPAEFSPQDLANTAVLYRKRTDVDGKEIWNPSGPWVAQVDDYSRAAPIPRAGPDYEIGSNGTLIGSGTRQGHADADERRRARRQPVPEAGNGGTDAFHAVAIRCGAQKRIERGWR